MFSMLNVNVIQAVSRARMLKSYLFPSPHILSLNDHKILIIHPMNIFKSDSPIYPQLLSSVISSKSVTFSLLTVHTPESM